MIILQRISQTIFRKRKHALRRCAFDNIDGLFFFLGPRGIENVPPGHENKTVGTQQDEYLPKTDDVRSLRRLPDSNAPCGRVFDNEIISIPRVPFTRPGPATQLSSDQSINCGGGVVFRVSRCVRASLTRITRNCWPTKGGWGTRGAKNLRDSTAGSDMMDSARVRVNSSAHLSRDHPLIAYVSAGVLGRVGRAMKVICLDCSRLHIHRRSVNNI